jgi:hypothetical protein
MSANETTAKKRYLAYRVVIERPRFELRIEAIRKDHSLDVLYRTHVGLGDAHSPTPEGRFVLNHLYPYPDVLYFDVNSNPVQGLYKGFFAPLSLCDGKGKCRRYRDMGIHGYEPKARDGRSARFTDTYGAISAGCVRVPDPCKFKTELIKLVGVGPLKSDDRGSYHWLRRPVEVIITDVDPDVEESLTLVSVFQQSIEQVQNGIKDIFSLFGN